jgi:hypothetical protein
MTVYTYSTDREYKKDKMLIGRHDAKKTRKYMEW